MANRRPSQAIMARRIAIGATVIRSRLVFRERIAFRRQFLYAFDLAILAANFIQSIGRTRYKIYFQTYADGTVYNCSRLSKESDNCGFFDEIHPTTDADIGNLLHANFPEHMLHKRGHGYWIWKPFLIKRLADQCRDGDIIVYADSGCSIQPHAKQWLEALRFDLVNNHADVIASTINLPNRSWCKKDTCIELGFSETDPVMSMSQAEANRIAIKVTPKTRTFLNDWLSLCSKLSLIDDTPSSSPEAQDFVEHRHDQSIFSLLLYKMGFQKGIEHAISATRLRS